MFLRLFSVVVVTLSTHLALAADAAVSFQDAPKYYNQTKTVEGSIVSTYCDEQRCFLNFDKDFRKYLSAVIESADLTHFTKVTGKAAQVEIDKMYLGKKVQITGAITEYKSKDPSKPGRPQIMVKTLESIKVLQ